MATTIDPYVLDDDPIDWELLVARLRYWSWQLGTKIFFGLAVYLTLMADGMQRVLPATSLKLYKVFFFAFMRGYQETQRLTVAHILCLFLLALVWWAWTNILRIWLGDTEAFRHRKFRAARSKAAIVLLGGVGIVFDAYVFYRGITEWEWGGGPFSPTALFATVAYVCILLFVINVAIGLEDKVRELKERKR
jgi:hypothetical protein